MPFPGALVTFGIGPIARMRDMAMFRDHKRERGEVEG